MTVASDHGLHDFAERLAFSEGVQVGGDMLAHLVASVAGATGIRRATTEDDRQGTDYWIDRPGLPSISVDVKHRSYCPIEKWKSDDACIETCSVYMGPPSGQWQQAYRKKLGWSIDATKRTDLVCYTWPNAQGGVRFWMLYFPHLCRAAQVHWRDWAATYGEFSARNHGYLTLSVYPPRQVIAAAIRELTVGTVSTGGTHV